MSDIEKIKQAISIEEVVARYVELKKAGINYSGRCPFHNEKTPSFYVSPDRGTFKCFGCGEGGDVYTFLEKIEGLDFKDVLHKLSEETGIQLEQKSYSQQENRTPKDSLYAVLQTATVFWQRNLTQNPQAIEYLKKRNFTKEQVINYQIGYASSSWSDLYEHLIAKQIPEHLIEQAGLIKKGDKGGYYDRFRDRIIFPLRSVSGKTVAFSGRYIGQDDVSAKYLNSPETPVFNKSKELYGFDTARLSMRKYNFAIVVEGQVDLVMGQSVFPNTVATSGTSLSRTHLEQIKRFCDRVIFVFDSDVAGKEAAFKASLIALELDFQVAIARVGENQDPADVITRDVGEYKKCIKEAQDVFDFWIYEIQHNSLSPREQTKLVESKIIPLLIHHGNTLEQSRYLTHVAFRLGIEEQALRDTFGQHMKTTQPKSSPLQKETEEPGLKNDESPYQSSLEHLALILLWQQSLDTTDRWVDPYRVSKELDEDLAEEIEKAKSRFTQDGVDEFFFKIEKEYKTSIMLQNQIQELQTVLRQRKLKYREQELLHAHRILVSQGKDEQAKQVLLELNTLLSHGSKKDKR